MKRFSLSIAALASLGLAGGAMAAMQDRSPPRLIAKVQPGLWEVTRPGTQAPAQRRCLRDVSVLAQQYHAGRSCTRVVVGQTETTAKVRYTCTSGGFGTSDLTLVTPRNLRIETQGIADDLPFYRVYAARRVGSC